MKVSCYCRSKKVRKKKKKKRGERNRIERRYDGVSMWFKRKREDKVGWMGGKG